MIVRKFGGTCIDGGARLAAAARLAARGGEACLVVVSAMGRTTRGLLALAQRAAEGRREEWEAGVEALWAAHLRTLAEAGVGDPEAVWVEEALERERSGLAARLREIEERGELEPASSDAVLAAGELLSSRIFAARLRRSGVAAEWIDPRELVATDGRFGFARPREGEIQGRVAALARPLLEGAGTVVTGGFVGQGPGRVTTTLGWEGSDYSAALLGAALPARAVEIWTDVDGVLTADPRFAPAARRIPRLSYGEAEELALLGAKVLHPSTMGPLVRAAIPLWVRNALRPGAAGTLISQAAAVGPILAVAARKSSLPSDPEPRGWGLLAREASHPVPLAAAGGAGGGSAAAVAAPVPLLGSFEAVEERGRVGVVSLLAGSAEGAAVVEGRALEALSPHPVLLAFRLHRRLSFVVPEEAIAGAVRCLHGAFFPARGPGG